jgi:hypothetical protein
MPFETFNVRATNARDVLFGIQRQLVQQLADVIPQEAVLLADPSEQWDGEDGQPEQTISTGGLTICLTDAEMPEELQTGGAAATCFEYSGVEITIFADNRLDQVGQEPAAVFDADNGLLELKRRLLKALVGVDLTGGDPPVPLLSELIPVRRSRKPRKNPSGIWYLTVEFGTLFLWDLT